MDPGRVLREARRAAGVSQRGLAGRSGVGLRTIAGIEAGARQPTVALLARLLDACDQHLAVQDGPAIETGDAMPPAPCSHLREHLRRSLTDRWHLATELTGQHEPLHASLRGVGGDLLLEPAAAVPVWVPGVALELPVVVDAHVWPHARAWSAPDPVLLVVRVRRSGLPVGSVRLRVHGGRDLHVLPPDVLARQHGCRRWRAGLLAAAGLLDVEAGRDDADRRAPAHRRPDEDEEGRRLAHALRYLGSPRPTALDSRALRLDAPVSLSQWMGARGLPPLAD